MRLTDYFDNVFQVAKREQGMSAGTLYVMRQSIKWLASSLDREPTLDDLSDKAVSALWRFIRANGRGRYTATWNCQRLVTLWRFAWKRGDKPGDKPTVAALKLAHSRSALSKRIPTSKRRKVGIPVPVVESQPSPLTPATRETPLMEFLTRHYRESHDIAPTSINNSYRSAVASFEAFLKRPAALADLNPATVNSWLAWLLERVSRETAHTHRRILLVLWRAAYEVEALAEYPRRVRPIKRPQRIIEGYDTEQMAELLRAADTLTGTFRQNSIERRLWWVAFLLVAWSTGLRLGDLLRIERGWVKPGEDGSGRLSLVMSKTGHVIHRLLPPNAMQALERLVLSGKPRKLCFPLWLDRREYFREFKALAESAGLPGSSKWIRRGSASEVEKLSAGMARYHLGHRSAQMFDLAYRVDRIVGSHVPLPPQPTFAPTLRLGFEPTAQKDGAA